jgi:hypothetical protein
LQEHAEQLVSFSPPLFGLVQLPDYHKPKSPLRPALHGQPWGRRCSPHEFPIQFLQPLHRFLLDHNVITGREEAVRGNFDPQFIFGAGQLIVGNQRQEMFDRLGLLQGGLEITAQFNEDSP